MTTTWIMKTLNRASSLRPATAGWPAAPKALQLGAIALAAGLSVLPQGGQACSSLQISASDGSSVVARTMDFPSDLKDKVMLHRRGLKVQSLNPDGSPGLAFATKYASFAIIALDVDEAVADGMNEKGLTIAAQWLAASTYPTSVPAERKNVALAFKDLGVWLLGQFATVDEVKAALPNVAVWAAPIKQMGNELPALHLILFDAGGKGIVIEYVDAKLHVYDNPVGVATNDPTFDWHLTNLQNYTGITGINTPLRKFGNLEVKTHASGGGLLGLPGDPMPPSRFVRLAVNRTNATQPANAREAVAMASHLINGVDSPLGTVRVDAKPNGPSETTIYTTLRDQRNSAYYIRPAKGYSFYRVDLSKLWDRQSVPQVSIVDLMNADLTDVTPLLLKP